MTLLRPLPTWQHIAEIRASELYVGVHEVNTCLDVVVKKLYGKAWKESIITGALKDGSANDHTAWMKCVALYGLRITMAYGP